MKKASPESAPLTAHEIRWLQMMPPWVDVRGDRILAYVDWLEQRKLDLEAEVQGERHRAVLAEDRVIRLTKVVERRG